MSNTFKVLIVLTFVLVLAMAAFLLWQELREPGREAGGSAITGISEKPTLYKDKDQWMKVIQTRLDYLKAKLNSSEKNKWDDIANFYGDDFVVSDKKADQHFNGGQEIAHNFWKKQFGQAKITDFKVIDLDIYRVNFPVFILCKADRLNQIVVYWGSLTWEASPAASCEFIGLAGHIQSCPDGFFNETYCK